MIVHYRHGEGAGPEDAPGREAYFLRSCAAAFVRVMGRGAACGAPGARQDRWILLI